MSSLTIRPTGMAESAGTIAVSTLTNVRCFGPVVPTASARLVRKGSRFYLARVSLSKQLIVYRCNGVHSGGRITEDCSRGLS